MRLEGKRGAPEAAPVVPIGAQAVPPAFPAPARVPPALRITPLDSDTCNEYSMFKSLLVTTDRTVTRDRLSNRRSDTRQQPTAAANPPTEAAGGRARGEGGVDSPAARPGSAQGRKAAQEAQRARAHSRTERGKHRHVERFSHDPVPAACPADGPARRIRPLHLLPDRRARAGHPGR